LDILNEIAGPEVTPGQVLLRWVIQHGAAVIAGGTSDKHLKENLQLFNFKLTDDEFDIMNSIKFEEMIKMYGPHPEEIL